jgi:predicted nuclease with RNAse H fold
LNTLTTLQKLDFLAAQPCVVGIDLTGSEKKSSGWAVLENGVALTRRVFSDADLIAATVKAAPAVVSIDSPLSLPRGRISVYDDDPGRHIYGITRLCERLMSKRGIRSYPTLIRSMQKLTLRGMLLAQEFRSRGFTVIESFPGGVQDILGLPRKQKSLVDLVSGLHLAGISGNFVEARVSHDEIDALTSALVGCFYLTGQYEALGDEEEGYLILPMLK